MKAIYLDCFSGISGNMVIGAFLDAGMPMSHLSSELEKLPVSSYTLIDKQVVKKGIKATYFNVDVRSWFQPSRNFDDIKKIINNSTLSEFVKGKAFAMFSRLAAAEAKVHGVAVDKIHFHEVGAVDSIIDIIGVAIGLEYFGIEHIYASALHTGSGYVKCSHGTMPVPAPATAELLVGIPFYSQNIKGELVTPTGAAIAAVLAEQFGPVPPGFITERVAYGAGSLDLEIPNVLRLYVGTVIASAQACHKAKLVETNMDDLNPQIYGYVMEKLFSAGAYDVFLTPVMMKKNRPGTKLTVMIGADKLSDVLQIIMKETSTLGVRILECDSTHLDREIVSVDTQWGKVRVKVGKMHGRAVNIAPEFDDCKALAEQYNIPLKAVQATVIMQCRQLVESLST